MVMKVYGYLPAWDLPCISPYVTKLCYWLKINNIPYEYVSEDLTKLDENAPYGKLPYIVDDDGTKVADSNKIIEYLEKKSGKSLDSDLSTQDKAVCLAFERLLGEHLYWSGVIEARWRRDSGWATYVPYVVGTTYEECTKELQGFLDWFRNRIVGEFNGQGMGRRDGAYVVELFKQDVDAISDFMGDKKYFMGDKVHNVDAAVTSMLRHLSDQPQEWEGSGYVRSHKNLAEYLDRMRKEFGT